MHIIGDLMACRRLPVDLVTVPDQALERLAHPGQPAPVDIRHTATMRMLVTSVDAEGCSCVVTETDLGGIAGEAKRPVVHKTTPAPPPFRPPRHGADRATRRPSDIVDYDVVLKGRWSSSSTMGHTCSEPTTWQS